MQLTDLRLSRTDPITGETVAAHWGRQFTELDSVVLVVRHTYRSATRHQLWHAEAYTDHLDPAACLEWARAGHCFGFAHIRRALLLRQICDLAGTAEWTEKRAAWLAVPRDPRWRDTYRAVSRGSRQWWLIPNDLALNSESGPFTSRAAALESRT